MTTKRMELLPGVWLNMVQTDRFKTGCVSVNLLLPLTERDASVNALVPSVLLRGCESYPDMQKISQRLDELYGASIGTLVRKKGEVQTVGLYADFLEDRYAEETSVFAQMMEFLQELLFKPCLEDGGFFREYVAGEKQNLINTISARINDKRTYAVVRLLKHMCAGEAYAVTRLGEKEALEGTTGKTLYERWQKMLKTAPIELFYLGQQPEEQVVMQMKKLIAPLPTRDSLAPIGTKVSRPERPTQYIEEAMDVTQGKLSIGFRTPITVHDVRYPAMMLLNAVFGSGMTSKLFMKIREEQSLCYYASSSLDKLKGVMVISSGIEFDKYEIARDGILHQLELCQRGDITQEELESARNYLISGLRTCNDSPGQLDDFAIAQAIAGLSGSVFDLIDQLRDVTLSQVIEAAKTLTLDTVYFLKGVQD